MTAMFRSLRLGLRRRPVGIAVGAHGATAALNRPSHDPLLIDRQAYHDGAAALESLLEDKQLIDAARRSGVRIAMLSPLVDDRLVTLPGLNATQAERALTFRAARHFSRVVENPVISATQPAGCGSDVFLASMASGVDIARIHSVIASAGICCLGVHSACAAWLENGADDLPGALVHDEVIVTSVRSGDRLIALRRVPLWSSTVADALVEVGLDPTALANGTVPDTGVFVAPLMIASCRRELLTDDVRGKRRRRALQRTAAMLAAAAMITIAGQLAAYVIQGRELAHLRRTRQENASMAQVELNQRNRRDAMMVAAADLADAEQAASVPHILAQLLPIIPPGTDLDMLEIGRDALVLAGAAPAADRVFAELVAASGTSRVEWIGPVRRSVEGESSAELFALTATLNTGHE
jgi:hypothetical protein